MRSELDQLEKFIQHCHTKHEDFSDSYITQTFNNMQDQLLVQFLNEELQHQQSKVDELQKRLGELVKTLDQKADASWKEWEAKAEMHEQGLANAYWEASELLEQALKGGEA